MCLNEIFIACKSDKQGYRNVDFWTMTSLKNYRSCQLELGHIPADVKSLKINFDKLED